MLDCSLHLPRPLPIPGQFMTCSEVIPQKKNSGIHKHGARAFPLSADRSVPDFVACTSTLACAVTCPIQGLILNTHTLMYSIAAHVDSDVLRSVVEHVFMPPELPQAHPGNRTEGKTNEALCSNLIRAARDFLQSLPPSQKPLWMQMIKMMELARRATKAPFTDVDLRRVLTEMDIGGAYRWTPFSALNLIILYQTYFSCVSARRMLRSLCAGFLSPTSFSLRCSKFCHRSLPS
jgi:hypothetical protein